MTDPISSSDRRFVSEAITPVEGSFETSSMAVGEPGLPTRFVWRETEYQIARVLKKWKTTGPCRHGSHEQYVRRHWYRVEVVGGAQMDIYFDRQPRFGSTKTRWWLATIAEPSPDLPGSARLHRPDSG